MKGSYKRIAAITLSLAMIAGNAGNFLTTNNALTAKALTVTAAEAQGKDESYYDAETGTLHLKGYVRNNNGVVLPNGVERKEVRHMIAEEGTVLPENCSRFCEGLELSSADMKNADTSNVTDMSYMFRLEDGECVVLADIDVSTFDTSKVTTMKGMFAWCLCSELDLSSFDTSNVTDMSEMFECCSYLTCLDISSFDTSSVTDMSRMFEHCWLLNPDLRKFNTSKVTDMAFMFHYCQIIRKLDLSSFDTSNVTEMVGMFRECVNLDTIYVSEKWSIPNIGNRISEKYPEYGFDIENNNDSIMFLGCQSLVGGAGTVYDDIHESEYAHIDGGKDNPGYLTNYEDAKNDESYFDVKTQTLHLKGNIRTADSFIRLVFPPGATWLNVKHLVADEGTVFPEDCSYLFSGMMELESVDLKNADTSNVEDMSEMFSNCSNLSKIYVGSDWLVKSAKGDKMFAGCENLVGGAGTAYDADHVDVDYAHVDGGKNDPGYLTLKENDFFKTQNLILSGQIGVSFNLDLSSLTDKERNASYMEFKINGRTSKVPFDKNSKNASGKYYSFTCYVTSVEMADAITAVFHYGNGNTISKKYSVLDYINAIEKNASSFDNKTLYLIRSIADYGHYSQPFLAASNNWTIGKEHKEMSKHYTSSYSYDAIRNVTSKYQRVFDLGKSDIEKISYSLSLNSGTSLNVFIKAKDNYKGSVKVTTKKGNVIMSYNAVKQADGRYKVTIPDISAHQLGDMYTVTAETTNGTATCSLSALSYVYAILSGSSDNAAKNAVSSLYIYSDATLNYRSKA